MTDVNKPHRLMTDIQYLVLWRLIPPLIFRFCEPEMALPTPTPSQSVFRFVLPSHSQVNKAPFIESEGRGKLKQELFVPYLNHCRLSASFGKGRF